MKLFGKDKPLYKLNDCERGTLQGILIAREQLQATAFDFINAIAKREEIAVGAIFDEKLQAFVRAPKPQDQPAQPEQSAPQVPANVTHP